MHTRNQQEKLRTPSRAASADSMLQLKTVILQVGLDTDTDRSHLPESMVYSCISPDFISLVVTDRSYQEQMLVTRCKDSNEVQLLNNDSRDSRYPQSIS